MAVSVVSLSFSRAAQPEAQEPSSLLDDSFLYCILSATSLDPNSIAGPRAPSAWCGFPYHITSLTPTVWLLSWLSYIIVQRPLNRPLNPWNGMFDRHQAEITVMRFTGHSLPVHQSMSVPWEFFLPCPISLAKHAYAISSHNCHWNVSLPSGASLWNGKFGRVEGTTNGKDRWQIIIFEWSKLLVNTSFILCECVYVCANFLTRPMYHSQIRLRETYMECLYIYT